MDIPYRIRMNTVFRKIVAAICVVVLLATVAYAFLAGREPNSRATALREIEQLGLSDSPGATERLLGMAGSSDSLISVPAIRALGLGQATPQRAKALSTLVQKESPVWKQEAALVALSDKHSGLIDHAVVRRFIRPDSPQSVKIAAITTLRRMLDYDTIPLLLDTIDKDPSLTARRHAFHALIIIFGRVPGCYPHDAPNIRARKVRDFRLTCGWEMEHIRKRHTAWVTEVMTARQGRRDRL